MPKRFESLFVCHTETLFLVDDNQSKVVELHVLRNDAMRADANIDLAGFQAFDSLALLLCRRESAEPSNR